MLPEFKYDVALSFLDKSDAQLAAQLNDELRDRYSTFLYTEHQTELVGLDGVDVLTRVFAEEARVAVVLYRQGWGDSGFTHAEMTGIRNRAFNETLDFTVFVPLDTPATIPRWLPRCYVWFGLQRFGVQGLCAVIEQRVAACNGEPRATTLEAAVARKQREMEHAKARAAFRREPAVHWAETEARGLLEAVQRRVAEIPSFQLTIAPRGNSAVVVSTGGLVLQIGWHARYTNTLDGARLGAVVWDGDPMSHPAFAMRRVQELSDQAYLPDLGADGRPTWVDGRGRMCTLDTIVDEALKALITAIPLPRT